MKLQKYVLTMKLEHVKRKVSDKMYRLGNYLY